MIFLITGGSKNGKSHIAEDILCKYDIEKYYIATMQPFGEEAEIAIERHRKMRSGKGFKTIEKYTDIDEIDLPQNCGVLLECVGNLVANEMFSAHSENVVEKILNNIKKLDMEVLVIVTNQVSYDGVEYPKETMEYIKNLCEINNRLSEIADTVIEAVYGIPVILKGELK